MSGRHRRETTEPEKTWDSTDGSGERRVDVEHGADDLDAGEAGVEA